MLIKNWGLKLLALLFITLFAALGAWQLYRGFEKKTLLSSFANRTQEAPLALSQLLEKKDVRFYRLELEGTFDNKHTLLLDNKTFHGQVGYEVYTPFFAEGLSAPILIDRGFIRAGSDRKSLPGIDTILGKIKIKGMLNLPPTYVALGPMEDTKQMKWPLRVEYVHLAKLTQHLSYALFPYILSLEPTHPAAYQMEWKIVMMSPDRHFGYALQWFALALTLLILSVVLNKRA